MSEVSEPFLDVSELNDSNVPYYGDMPDVSMAFPWSANILPADAQTNGNPDQPNGAVWPWRVFLGAEDDPNREKVAMWEQVDDLANLAPGVVLWAGVYNGTIYLHAGKDAPGATDEDTDSTGTPISGAANMPERWRNGQPVLPFTPLPQDMRDQMLKNESEQWRRLVWEPVGLFDIAPSKNVQGYNFYRFTLWMIVEHPFIAFYTTKTALTAETQQDGAPARWPFSYYAALNRDGQPTDYQPGDKDGGFTFGWYNSFSNGYRLAPLPWQVENDGEIESESAFTPFDGVQQGQFYTLPPGWPCGRYLATAFDYRVTADLTKAYRGEDAHYDFEHISKERAKQAIVDTIRTAATHSYSIDPALMEELGRSWPDGALEGTLWQTDPPEFETVFSLHLDETTERWPHWLALMACHAPTALLTASSCAWYNDFRPAGGWPSGSYDPSNPPPSEDTDDPDDKPPSGTESDGGYIPDRPDDDDEDDEETDSDKDGVQELPVGYYYEAGNGVQIRREWNALTNQSNHLDRPPGWNHVIHVDDIGTSGFANYNILLTVETKNDTKTYDWPENEQYGLSMYYGVSASGSEIKVTWKSSFQFQDTDAKQTTAIAGTACNFTARIEISDLAVTSETPPDFCGTFLIATKTRSFTKRGTYKTWDKFRQRWMLQRYSRRFDVYRLSVRGEVEKYAVAYTAAHAPERQGSYNPAYRQGKSSDLDGPKVTATDARGAVKIAAPVNRPLNMPSATIIADYEPCQASFNVTGTASWNSVNGKPTKSGSISGSFTASLPQTTATFEA